MPLDWVYFITHRLWEFFDPFLDSEVPAGLATVLRAVSGMDQKYPEHISHPGFACRSLSRSIPAGEPAEVGYSRICAQWSWHPTRVPGRRFLIRTPET